MIAEKTETKRLVEMTEAELRQYIRELDLEIKRRLAALVEQVDEALRRIDGR